MGSNPISPGTTVLSQVNLQTIASMKKPLFTVRLFIEPVGLNPAGLSPDSDLGLNPDSDRGLNPDSDRGLNPDSDRGLNPDSDRGLSPDPVSSNPISTGPTVFPQVNLITVLSMKKPLFHSPEFSLNPMIWKEQLPQLSQFPPLSTLRGGVPQTLLPDLPVGARLLVFAERWSWITTDRWVLDLLASGLQLEFGNEEAAALQFELLIVPR